MPFGYESRVVVTDGRKGRKKLFIIGGEAAIVRLIYELASLGLTGRPIGTRACQAPQRQRIRASQHSRSSIATSMSF
ncbi:hypothetical protein [uncultured Sphingomonas sp.]|uniref:hypothetical protein n=1 Tax=uncultured Sphingomonas sp. TaxID=158754 RepID=UPI0035CC35C2